MVFSFSLFRIFKAGGMLVFARGRFVCLLPFVVPACERPPALAPLTVEAYVWQAPGRPGVAEAVEMSREAIGIHHFRAAEFRWTKGGFEAENVVLERLPAPGAGLVVRIGASAAGIAWDDGQRREIARAVARLATLEPREIQCDYDCPQRRLDVYRRLLADLRAAAGPVPVVPTVLPSWLDEPAFAALATESPGYVLQVHSLELPSGGGPVTVFDPALARRAVAKAARLGVPFRVAMATYGCEVWFDDVGNVMEVISEDRPPFGMVPARRAYAFADPEAAAALVAEWITQRPAGLTGIVWYRLPVAGDRRNWPWQTLAKVARGERAAPVIEVDRASAGRAGDLWIENRGTGPGRLPRRLTALGPVAAADAVGAYRFAPGADRATFVLRDDVWPWLDPGGRIVIGWVTTKEAEDRIEWDWR